MDIMRSSSAKSELQRLQKTLQARWAYLRVTSILMLSEGLRIDQICTYLGVDDNSVYRYQKAFTTLPLDEFLSRDYKGYSGKLDQDQWSKLKTELQSKRYTATQEVNQWVEAHFKVVDTLSGMSTLWNRLGFRYKKTKSVPCQAAAEQQKEFLEKLDPLLEEQDAVVYDTDGVHPTHHTRARYGWILSGKEYEIPTVSGSDRIHIHGAVHAKNPSEVIMEEGDTMEAENTKAFYQKIIKKNPNAKKIYVIAANARYHRNKMLTAWIKGTIIVQVFLPPYSPNLNLMERLWKWMRKKAMDPVFYRTKEAFRSAMLSFFENIDPYQEELKSLLTLNFHGIQSKFDIK